MTFRKKTLAAILSLLAMQSFVFGFHGKGYQYLYPNPDALHVDPSAGLIIRFERFSPDMIGNLDDMITMDGQEGRHYSGAVKIAGDKKTIRFQPDRPFQPGETIQVLIAPELRPGGEPIRSAISLPCHLPLFRPGRRPVFRLWPNRTRILLPEEHRPLLCRTGYPCPPTFPELISRSTIILMTNTFSLTIGADAVFPIM